ncbi:MAG: hypothetical protein K0S32_2333 [Bacteroidetes bacterium]|nr:hypothetical protein [Bacteroidota bacterium]
MNNEAYITDYFKSDKEPGGDLNLSLFIENQLFMFAVFNADFTSVSEICHVRINAGGIKGNSLNDHLTFLFNNYRLTQRKFKQVNICVLNHHFSLTPESFAMFENAKSFLKFSSGEEEMKNSYSYRFDNINFCYSIENDLVPFLEKQFKNATVRHAGAVNINLLFSNNSLKSCNLFLNFNKGVFELAAKENNKLLYYNVFNYETNEDVLYYLLFMMEQYELNPLTCKLSVAGQIEADGELLKSIRKYVKTVTLAVNDKSFSKSFADVKLPDHYFFSLTNQHLCAL